MKRYFTRDLIRWMSRYKWNAKERREYYKTYKLQRFELRNESPCMLNAVNMWRTILKD